jgi:hypothetical protein
MNCPACHRPIVQAKSEPALSERTVRMKLIDRARGLYVVEGRGPRLELASREVAELECLRRVSQPGRTGSIGR